MICFKIKSLDVSSFKLLKEARAFVIHQTILFSSCVVFCKTFQLLLNIAPLQVPKNLRFRPLFLFFSKLQDVVGPFSQ
jgi:hypothetical protein